MQNLVEQVDVVLSRCVAELRRALPRPTSKPLSQRRLPNGNPPRRPRSSVGKTPGRQHAKPATSRCWPCDRKAATRWRSPSTWECTHGRSSRWTRHFRQDRHRRKRPSAFDRFAPYVWERWQAGCRNGLRLWEELVALGYPGSDVSVYRYLKTLRNGFVPVFPEEAPLATPASRDACASLSLRA